MLNILVCMKLVPDPEGPPSSYEVDEEAKKVKVRGISPVANPYDENALEAALRLKESADAKVTVLTMGGSISKAVMLKALASGADDSIVLEGNGFDVNLFDSGKTAKILASAIKKSGEYDIIFSGRQASDTNAGLVGFGIAAELGFPVISLAQKVSYGDDKFIIERVLPNGYEVVEAPRGLVVTVSGELGELRYPSMAAIKGAKKLPQKALTLEELEVDVSDELSVETVELKRPVRERSCTMIEADCGEDAGRELAEKLIADKVL